MAHIMRVNELHVFNDQKGTFSDFFNDGNIGVIITDNLGNTGCKEGEIIENIDDFVYHCNSICEKCNGTMYVTLGKNSNTYNVTITDENDKNYAEIDFMIIYYNKDALDYLNNRFVLID